MNDELRQDSVEVTIGKRQQRSAAATRTSTGCRSWAAAANCSDGSTAYGCRSETSDELGRQRARATADIERTVARYDLGEVGNDGASRTEYRPMKRS